MKQTTLAEKISAPFQPDPNHMYQDELKYMLDQRLLARLVGLIAVFLPLALAVDGMLSACFFNSISHFYYSRFSGGLFVLGLGISGTFLIAYRGESKLENRLATLAGISAFLVAFFPTEGPGCEMLGFEARIFANVGGSNLTDANLGVPEVGGIFTFAPSSFSIHIVAAAVFLLILAFFALVVFTRVVPQAHVGADGRLTRNKKIRNVLYAGAGFIIVASLAALSANVIWGLPSGQVNAWDLANATFIFEAIALIAFGFSWMLKARFFGTWLLDEHELAVVVQSRS